jgi:hypothetical protein
MMQEYIHVDLTTGAVAAQDSRSRWKFLREDPKKQRASVGLDEGGYNILLHRLSPPTTRSS